jgi:DNA-binding NarL/FixJ family response regulator
MAKQIEANGHAALLPQRTSAGTSAPDLAPMAATLVSALEQALLAAQRLLGALDGAARCETNAAMHQAQVLRLLAPLGPGGVVGQPACCCADDAAGAIHDLPAATTTTAGLTRREGEVLRLLAAGQSNQRIAHLLCLSPRTVQRHIANLYPKVGAHNRAEATAYALRHGLT